MDVVGEANRPLLDRLAEDDHVRGLLVLHDLHPKSTHERVTEALDKVRPYLGSHAGDVEFVGIDDDGVLRLQLQGTCDGCPSSTVTAKYAIERMVREVAPEISDVVVEGVVPEETGPGGRPLLPLEPSSVPWRSGDRRPAGASARPHRAPPPASGARCARNRSAPSTGT